MRSRSGADRGALGLLVRLHPTVSFPDFVFVGCSSKADADAGSVIVSPWRQSPLWVEADSHLSSSFTETSKDRNRRTKDLVGLTRLHLQ